MKMRCLPSYHITWATSFTSHRRLGFAFDQKNEPHQPFNSGLPQGSPASPVLFLLYANAMFETDQRSAFSTLISDVDDVTLVETSCNIGNNIHTLKERITLQLQRGALLGLTYSPPKSDLLFMHPITSKDRTKSLTTNPTLNINGTVIQPCRSFTYLGVIIDESLSFKPHANKAASKGRQAIGSLNFLHHRQWSVSAQVLHHLALTAVLPKMLWASPIWWTGHYSVLHQQKKMVPYRACGARPCLERPISTERHSTKTAPIYWLHAPHSACVRKHTPRTGVGTQR
jgi:hypothetical protein